MEARKQLPRTETHEPSGLSAPRRARFPQNKLWLSWYINGAPSEVFAAWTQPGLMKRWFCPEGMRVVSLHAEAVPGGEYSVTMRGNGPLYTAYGNFEEVIAPRRLSFTWEWESDPDYTLLAVEFYPSGKGTELHLMQEGFVNQAEAREHEEGWASALRHLSRLFP